MSSATQGAERAAGVGCADAAFHARAQIAASARGLRCMPRNVAAGARRSLRAGLPLSRSPPTLAKFVVLPISPEGRMAASTRTSFRIGAPRALTLIATIAIAACAGSTSSGTMAASPSVSAPIVGPPRGTILVVGGGGQGPELYKAFIDGAGGPNALIVTVPTAGGDTVYPPETGSARQLKAAGAKNVVVLHSAAYRKDLANSDSFVNILRRAGGVWYDGGRQWHIYNSYAGTKTQTEIENVLARGGIVGGSSAGASILGSFMVRGAPSNNNMIMEYPGWEKGFAYLRNTGIDQHVVARGRLPDIADSLIPRHKDMFFISEDEGTAWLIKGDDAEIVGRNKAFAYNGKATDPGKPFLTLFPGDKYHLGTRTLVRRAIDDSPLTMAFVDSVFAGVPSGAKVTVHIAQEGRVFAAKAYGVPKQERLTPETGSPNFDAGEISDAMLSTLALGAVTAKRFSLDDPLSQGGSATVREFLTRANAAPDGRAKIVRLLLQKDTTLAVQFQRRITGGTGNQRARLGEDGKLMANVDDLYRIELGLRAVPAMTVAGADSVFAPNGGKGKTGNGLGWRLDTYRGLPRQIAFVGPDGKQGIWVRVPGHKASIIILSDQPAFDAKAAATRIMDRLFFEYRDRSLFRKASVASNSSCRSLSVASTQVAWAGCTAGKVFRTTDGGATWAVDSVRGAARLDFRGIKAFDALTAVAVSAGPAEDGAAKIFRTADGGKNWALTWSDTTKGIFLDGVAFWDVNNGFTFSDAVDGRFVILTTSDGGRSWNRVPAANIPAALENEGAFAASNTQLTVQGSSNGWIATGAGPAARVLRTNDRGRTWKVAETGMSASGSTGFFGIAFADALNGLAIGGDYRNERGVAAFAMRTSDGGVTWNPAGVRRPDGTTSGLVYVPGTTPPLFVAVGQTGVAYTRDFGSSWIHADTLTAWGVGFANASTGFVAGPRGHVAVLSTLLK
jgi:cyanophycinase